MRTVYFNFNNEVDVLTLEQNEETGVVTIPGQDDMEFDNINAFAEHYALARDVHPTNLKNWELLEQGETYVFALRAATGGISTREVKNELEEVLTELDSDFHVLDVRAVQEYLKGKKDIVDALTTYEDKAIAKAVYDALDGKGALEVEEEEVDERSEVEIVLDTAIEEVGSVALFAKALNLDADANKEEVMSEASLFNFNGQDLLDAVDEVMYQLQTTTGVNEPAILSALVAQEATGLSDDNAVTRLTSVSRIAGRDSINLRVVRVGKKFVKDTSTRVTFDELAEKDVRIVNDVLTTFSFEEEVDDEVRAEIAERNAEIEAEEEEMRLRMEEEEEDFYDEEDEETFGERFDLF